MRFWGALNHAELAERFSAAHLLIVPSSYEGFGIVYLEAMSFGFPPLPPRPARRTRLSPTAVMAT
ncbi:MAG: glycosyltransferase [Chloroflexi bacterium]|nr:glycosyltransferase [Chloroflexota bacterium]